MKIFENFKKMLKMTDYCSTCHCEGVRKHDCGNPFFRVEKNLDCHAHFRSLAMTGKKKVAFTLAETLITLTILGVVAAITVPMLINKQMEAANRTKVKKAMTNYEKVLNQIVIDNDLKTDAALTNWTQNQYDCDKTIKYFKAVDEIDPCIVKMSDGLWWDIGDIKNPIIFLDKKLLTMDWEVRYNYTKTLEDENGKKINVYGMVGYIDDKGILRINDLGVATGDNKTILTKLYGFINSNNSLETANTCDYLCQMQKITDECPANCEDTNSCTSCKICDENHGDQYNITHGIAPGSIGCTYYNNNKENIGYMSGTTKFLFSSEECTNTTNGKTCKRYDACNQEDGYCENIYITEFDSDNNLIKTINKDGCTINSGVESNCDILITRPNDLTEYCNNDMACIKGIPVDDIDISDYGFEDVPFTTKTFNHNFIEIDAENAQKLQNGETPDNFTAYLCNSNHDYSLQAKNMVDNGEYSNIIKVENGQPSLLGEFNPSNGTTIEADMKTGVVTIYQNCDGYKNNCDAQTQTTTVDALFNQ